MVLLFRMQGSVAYLCVCLCVHVFHKNNIGDVSSTIKTKLLIISDGFVVIDFKEKKYFAILMFYACTSFALQCQNT
jgi:hypothetical protein